MLCIYKATYSVCGSYMASITPSNILTVCFVALHFFVVLGFTLLSCVVIGIIADKANTDVSKITYLLDGGENSVPHITSTLQGIGYLGK